MFAKRKGRRSNLSVLSSALKEVIEDDSKKAEPPRLNETTPSTAQQKTKPSKREVPIEGNGVVEKAIGKKGPKFISFKNLLTG